MRVESIWSGQSSAPIDNPGPVGPAVLALGGCVGEEDGVVGHTSLRDEIHDQADDLVFLPWLALRGEQCDGLGARGDRNRTRQQGETNFGTAGNADLTGDYRR